MTDFNKCQCRTQPLATCFWYNGVEYIYNETLVEIFKLKIAKRSAMSNIVVEYKGIEFDFDRDSQQDLTDACVLNVQSMLWKAKDNKVYEIVPLALKTIVSEQKLQIFNTFEKMIADLYSTIK